MIDLGQVIAMPFCTMLLADLGARVIKVESPERGRERVSLGVKRRRDGIEERVPAAQYRDRNKLGVTLELKTPAGLELFRELVRHADVVTENFSVGTMERLGLGYDDLRRVNPRLVYASITAFGQTGPYAPQRGYDMLAQAISGYMSITGYPDGPPTRSGQSISDYYAGMLCAFSIVSALHYRQRTGQGTAHRPGPPRQPPGRAGQPRGALHGGRRDPHPRRQRLVRRLGHRDLPDDRRPRGRRRLREQRGVGPVLRGHRPGRSDPRPRVRHRGRPPRPPRRDRRDHSTVDRRARAKAEVVRILTTAGVPAAPVNNVAEMVADPQVQAREMFVERDHPVYGPLRTTGTPLKLSETPGRGPLARAHAGGAQRGGVRRAARPLAR